MHFNFGGDTVPYSLAGGCAVDGHEESGLVSSIPHGGQKFEIDA